MMVIVQPVDPLTVIANDMLSSSALTRAISTYISSPAWRVACAAMEIVDRRIDENTRAIGQPYGTICTYPINADVTASASYATCATIRWISGQIDQIAVAQG